MYLESNFKYRWNFLPNMVLQWNEKENDQIEIERELDGRTWLLIMVYCCEFMIVSKLTPPFMISHTSSTSILCKQFYIACVYCLLMNCFLNFYFPSISYLNTTATQDEVYFLSHDQRFSMFRSSKAFWDALYSSSILQEICSANMRCSTNFCRTWSFC